MTPRRDIGNPNPVSPPDNQLHDHETPSQRLTKPHFFPPLQPKDPFSSAHILAGGCPALYSTSSEDDMSQECLKAKNKGYAPCSFPSSSSPTAVRSRCADSADSLRRCWKSQPTWQQPPSSNHSLRSPKDLMGLFYRMVIRVAGGVSHSVHEGFGIIVGVCMRGFVFLQS